MEINDKRLEADLDEMRQKEKQELEILKLSYEIAEKKKNIFKRNEWTLKDFIGPILTALTLVVSVTSIFMTFKIQNKQLEINTHILGSNNLRELLLWVVDSNEKKHDMAMQQLKYYGSQTLPIYLNEILVDTTFINDDMANAISCIIDISHENDVERQQIIYDLNSFFEMHLFQKIENNKLPANQIVDLKNLLNKKIYPIFKEIDYKSILPSSLSIYNITKIDTATKRLVNLYKDNEDATDLQTSWLNDAKNTIKNEN